MREKFSLKKVIIFAALIVFVGICFILSNKYFTTLISNHTKWWAILAIVVVIIIVTLINGSILSVIKDQIEDFIKSLIKNAENDSENIVKRIIKSFFKIKRKLATKLLDLLDPHGLVRMRESIIDREKELDKFESFLKILDKGAESAGLLHIFGFAGNGKSALLRAFASKLRKDSSFGFFPAIGTPRKGAGMGAGETLSTFLFRILRLDKSFDKKKTPTIEELSREVHNRVLFIDEFPEKDKEFTVELASLLKTCVDVGIRTAVVTASRLCPSIPISICRETILLEGLKEDPLREFISCFSGADAYPEIVANFDTFFCITVGNPWIARAVILSPVKVWCRISEGKTIYSEMVNVGGFLLEIWDSLQDDQAKRAIEVLSVVNKYSDIWPESLARSLIPTWAKTRSLLLSRGLLDIVSDEFAKIHALLASFIYDRLETKESLHEIVGDVYAKLASNWSEGAIFALRHYLDAGASEKIGRIYRDAITEARMRLPCDELESLIVLVESMRITGLKQSEIIKDKAYAMLRRGRIEEALGIYDKALDLYKKEEQDADNRIIEGEILWGKADSLRMLGRFINGRECFQTAIECFANLGTPYAHCYVQAKVEYGHSFYLVGEPNKALSHYEEALKICKKSNLNAELAQVLYRISKAKRASGYFDEGIDYARKSVEAFNYEEGRAKALWNLGTCLRMAGKYAEAVDKLLEAEKILHYLKHRDAIFVRHDFAEIARAQEDYDKALSIYREVLPLIHKIGDDNRIAHTKLGLLETERMMLPKNMSISSYDEVLSIYEKISSIWGRINVVIGHVLLELNTTNDTGQYLRSNKTFLGLTEDAARECGLQYETELLKSILTGEPSSWLHPLNFL